MQPTGKSLLETSIHIYKGSIRFVSGTKVAGKVAEQLGYIILNLYLEKYLEFDLSKWSYTTYRPEHVDAVWMFPTCTDCNKIVFCRAHANGNPSELINEPMLLAKMLFTFCQCDWPIPVSCFSILLPMQRIPWAFQCAPLPRGGDYQCLGSALYGKNNYSTVWLKIQRLIRVQTSRRWGVLSSKNCKQQNATSPKSIYNAKRSQMPFDSQMIKNQYVKNRIKIQYSYA